MEKSTFSPLYGELRARLLAIRKKAGYTQRQLAERLKREPSFVARVEMGERRVDLLEFYFICRACGVSPHQVAADIMKRFAKEDRKRSNTSKAKR